MAINIRQLQTCADHIFDSLGDLAVDVTINRVTRGAYNPATASYAADTTTTVTVKGFRTRVGQSDLGDSHGIRTLLTVPTSKAGEVNLVDTVVFNGNEWNIISIDADQFVTELTLGR